MNQDIYDSLCAILEYLSEDEKEHWEENGRPKLHIWNHIATVKGWADEVAGRLP